MPFEVDHLFICTDRYAPVADRLIALGLIEGSANTHPGQGTANRRFFFRNAMVELLWVHNPEEAQSEAIARTHLWERWRDRQSGCPFGICLRSAPGSMDNPTFSSWEFKPPYLPDTLSISVATNSDRLDEPMLFQTPFSRRPDQQPIEKQQPFDHPIGWGELTQVTLVSPSALVLSSEFRSVLDNSSIRVEPGDDYCLKLEFDGSRTGRMIDLRPELPIVLMG
jgi:Glyoxalase-like domain